MNTMPHLVNESDSNADVSKGGLFDTKAYNPNENIFLQSIQNIPASGKQLAKDIITPLLSPVQTAKDIKELGSSVINLIRPGEQGNEELGRQVGQFFVDRYGSLDAIKKTFAEDPVAMLSDLSIIFTGGAMLAPKASATANLLSKAAKIDPVAGAVTAAGMPLRAIPKVVEMVGGVPADAQKIAFAAGQSSSLNPLKSNAFVASMRGGTEVSEIVEDANKAFEKLKTKKTSNYKSDMAKLSLNTKKMDLGFVFNKIDEIKKSKLDSEGVISEFSGANLDVLNAVENLVTEFNKKLDGRPPNAEQLNILKRQLNNLYPAQKGMGASQELISKVTSEIGQEIEKVAPGFQKVNKNYLDAIALERELIEALSLGNTKNASTTLKKLQSVMRNNTTTNYGARLDSLNKLDDLTNLFEESQIMQKLAGQELNPFRGRGFTGGAQTGSFLSSFFNPMALLISAASTPRLVGEMAYLTGKTAGKVPTVPILQSSRITGSVINDENVNPLLQRGFVQ